MHDRLLKAEDQIHLDAEKAKAWLEKGVQPSDTVKDLLAKTGIVKK